MSGRFPSPLLLQLRCFCFTFVLLKHAFNEARLKYYVSLHFVVVVVAVVVVVVVVVARSV